ncbi:MAG: SulP family inorganic anion transporter, partial [Deltaproteobacteria bacterium]
MKRLISKRFYSDVFLTHARARLCVALRESFREGYGFSEFKKDAIAGIIVGIVALPLSMALAIATGLPPEYGIYTS